MLTGVAEDIRSSGNGRDIAVLVDKRCCNLGHVTVKEKICVWETELLAESLHSYYLQRELIYGIQVAM